jgi:hypothetical protein
LRLHNAQCVTGFDALNLARVAREDDTRIALVGQPEQLHHLTSRDHHPSFEDHPSFVQDNDTLAERRLPLLILEHSFDGDSFAKADRLGFPDRVHGGRQRRVQTGHRHETKTVQLVQQSCDIGFSDGYNHRSAQVVLRRDVECTRRDEGKERAA